MRTVNRGRLPDTFTGLFTPRYLFEIQGLSSPKRTLLAEVLALQKKDGCYATNAHFGLMIDCSDRQVRAHIAELEQAGHLVISNRSSFRRRMWVSDDIAEGCGHAATLRRSGASDASADERNLSAGLELPAGKKPDASAEKAERATPQRNPTIEQHADRELPDFIDRAQWLEFVAARHDQHGPFSDGAAKGVIAKITRLRREGYCPTKLLTGAIEGRWRSVAENERFKVTDSVKAGDQRRRFVIGAAQQ